MRETYLGTYILIHNDTRDIEETAIGCKGHRLHVSQDSKFCSICGKPLEKISYTCKLYKDMDIREAVNDYKVSYSRIDTVDGRRTVVYPWRGEKGEVIHIEDDENLKVEDFQITQETVSKSLSEFCTTYEKMIEILSLEFKMDVRFGLLFP